MARTPNQQPRTIAAVREKEASALAMIRDGAQLAAIAAALGYANESGAWKAVQRALSRIGKPEADELRAIEQERLGALYRHTLNILDRQHPVLYKGAPVLVDGEPLDDDMVKLRAIEVLIRADESYRRLLGLDAPTKHEHSGEDGAPIPMEITVKAILDRVAVARQQLELPPGELDEPQEA